MPEGEHERPRGGYPGYWWQRTRTQWSTHMESNRFRTRGHAADVRIGIRGADAALPKPCRRRYCDRVDWGGHIIPGLWAYGSYKPLTKRLCGVADAEVLEFPYDWRRSNSNTAARLDKVVEAALKERSDDVSVVLVAHSMGGLVARNYLATGKTADRCRLLVTIGTPYRGAVKALDKLVNGMPGPGKLGRRLTKLVRSLPSVYELLPTYDCIVAPDATRTALAEHRGLPLDVDLFDCAVAMHAETNAAFTDAHDAVVDTVAIVGQRQRTSTFATYRDGIVEIVDDDTWVQTSAGQRLIRGGGDGTVPRGSSQPPEWGMSVQGAQPLSGRHVDLPQSKAVWNAIEGAITGHQFLGLSEDGPGFGIGIPDAISAPEPLVVDAAHSRDGLRLDLWVYDADSRKQVAQRRLRNTGDGHYSASVASLDPGIYTAVVSGNVDGAPRKVSDVVVIFPADN